MQEHLGVASGTKMPAARFQLGAQLAIVVYLAIECHDDLAVVAGHRLRRGLGQVYDGKPAMAQAYRTLKAVPFAGTVRPAALHLAEHALHGCSLNRLAVAIITDGPYSAHARLRDYMCPALRA